MTLRIKKVLLFIAITYLLSGLLIAIYAASGGRWRGTSGGIVAMFYMLVPLISTILVQTIIFKQSFFRNLDVRFSWNRWWLIAWMLPPVIAFASFGISLLLPSVRFSPDFTGMLDRMTQDLSAEQIENIRQQLHDLPVHPLFLSALQALIAGITINALLGFGEEIGWRGLLQNELKDLGFWKSSFLVGTIWGIWHAPIILMGHNFPNYRVIGVFAMIAWTVALSPLFAWVRYRGKSVIVAAVLHGTINASPVIALLMLEGGNELLIGITGLSGIIVLVIINTIIWLFEKFVFSTSTNDMMQVAGNREHRL